MKPTRLICVAVLLLTTLPLLAPSCGKSRDPAPKNAHPATVASVWAWQNLLISPPVGNIDDILDFYVQLNVVTAQCLPIFLYDFKSDGTITPIQETICPATGISALSFGPQTGDKWSVSGSTITITHPDGSKDAASLELKDGTLASGAKSKIMIWKRKIGDQTYTWKFERKV